MCMRISRGGFRSSSVLDHNLLGTCIEGVVNETLHTMEMDFRGYTSLNTGIELLFGSK